MSLRQINECFSKRYLTEGKNLDKTWEQYKDKLLKVERVNTEEQARNMFNYIISIDPTYEEGRGTTGDYGTWLLNRFIAGDEIVGNVSNVESLLNDFRKKKSNLANKDINSYKSIKELEDTLKDTEFSQRQLDRQRKNASNIEGADLLLNGNDWLVYSPNTYEASCALRNGKYPATWCTGSTTNDYHYRNYTSKGKLYIIINKNDPSEKYQAYVRDGEKKVDEFRDIHNKAVRFKKFLSDKQELQQCFYDKGIVDTPSDDKEDSDMDERARALARWLELGEDDYIDSLGNNAYRTDDGEEYYVLTADEAFEMAVDLTEDLLNQCSYEDIKGNQWWFYEILENIDDDQVSDFVRDEIYEYMMEDWENAVSRGDSLGLIASDFDEDTSNRGYTVLPRNWFFDPETDEMLDEDDIEDSHMDELCEIIAGDFDGENSASDWLNNAYGEDETVRLSFSYGWINWRDVAADVVNADGPANTLATADGEELDLGDGLYAYRYD